MEQWTMKANGVLMYSFWMECCLDIPTFLHFNEIVHVHSQETRKYSPNWDKTKCLTKFQLNERNREIGALLVTMFDDCFT